MKVKLNIDLTPAEARELMGLPDVKTVQDKWMKEVGDKLMANSKNFSPDEIMKKWVAGAGGNMDWLPGMMSAFTQGKK